MSAIGYRTELVMVRDILLSQPDYLRHLPADYEHRAIFPALAHNKLRLLCCGRAFMTWFKPVYPPDGPPDPREFAEDGPLVWLVDVVALPGVPAMRLGREIAKALNVYAGVRDGERVPFMRWPSGRYGHICAREPRRSV